MHRYGEDVTGLDVKGVAYRFVRIGLHGIVAGQQWECSYQQRISIVEVLKACGLDKARFVCFPKRIDGEYILPLECKAADTAQTRAGYKLLEVLLRVVNKHDAASQVDAVHYVLEGVLRKLNRKEGPVGYGRVSQAKHAEHLKWFHKAARAKMAKKVDLVELRGSDNLCSWAEGFPDVQHAQSVVEYAKSYGYEATLIRYDIGSKGPAVRFRVPERLFV